MKEFSTEAPLRVVTGAAGPWRARVVVSIEDMWRSTRVRVKFCGITRLEDAAAAVALGVHALGFVFAARSARYIDPAAAKAIIDELPPFVCKVGLFVDASVDEVKRIATLTGVDLVQYHGEESPRRCVAGDKPFIKALQMKEGVDVAAVCRDYARAAAILLDTYDSAAAGGTGRTFDWARVPAEVSKPLILAGGLSQDNVAQAIRRVAPYAVDVCGGIETRKGVKDPMKMRAFVDEVNSLAR